MIRIAAIETLAAALLMMAAPPAQAASRDGLITTETYRVRHDARRNVYCIRFFADLPAADPTPGPTRDTCQSRAAWNADGVQIDDRRRPPPRSEAS